MKSVKFKTFEMGVVALTRVTTVLAEERTITYQDDEKLLLLLFQIQKLYQKMQHLLLMKYSFLMNKRNWLKIVWIHQSR